MDNTVWRQARKTNGIYIVSESIVDGPTTSKSSKVIFSARFYLRRGDEVTPDYQSIDRYGNRVSTRVVGEKTLIEHNMVLGKRRSIAGIERALIGLSAGSYREVIIPPHLGYGSKGLGDLIPPNALLRAQIWLHDITTDN